MAAESAGGAQRGGFPHFPHFPQGTRDSGRAGLPQACEEGRGRRAMTLDSYQRTVGKSQVLITPRWIIEALGPFGLDPCAAAPRPWPCATINSTSNGLERP